MDRKADSGSIRIRHSSQLQIMDCTRTAFSPSQLLPYRNTSLFGLPNQTSKLLIP